MYKIRQSLKPQHKQMINKENSKKLQMKNNSSQKDRNVQYNTNKWKHVYNNRNKNLYN